MLCCLVHNEPTPVRDDWCNILRPVKYAFETSWHARATKLLLFLVFTLSIIGAVNYTDQIADLWTRENIPVLLWGIMMLAIIFSLLHIKMHRDTIPPLVITAGIGLGPAVGVMIWSITGNWILALNFCIIGNIIGIVICIATNIPKINLLYGFIAGSSSLAIIVAIGGDFAHLFVTATICIIASVFFFVIAYALDKWTHFKGSTADKINKVLVGIFFGVTTGILFGVVAGSFGISITNLIFVITGNILGGAALGAFNFFGIFNTAEDGRAISLFLTGIIAGAIFTAICIQLVYLPTKIIYSSWGWLGTVLFWITWWICYSLLLLYGWRQERRAQNPLHGLLDEHYYNNTVHTFRLQSLMLKVPGIK